MQAEQFKQVYETLKEIKSDVKELHTALYVGNGQKPVMSRMEAAEAAIKELKSIKTKLLGANIVGLALLSMMFSDVAYRYQIFKYIFYLIKGFII